MDQNKDIDRGFRQKKISVPKTFDQLIILVLDGSNSMKNSYARSERTLAEELSYVVNSCLQPMPNAMNFSCAIVYCDDRSKIRLNITPLKNFKENASYNPTERSGEYNSIAIGLKKAKIISDYFLLGSETNGLSRSVKIIVISDGMEPEKEKSIVIAKDLRSKYKVDIASYFLETAGLNFSKIEESKSFMRKLAIDKDYIGVFQDNYSSYHYPITCPDRLRDLLFRVS